MDFKLYPKQIGAASYLGEQCPIIEITCPVCGLDRVEPLPSLYNDKWFCCTCEFTFTVEPLIKE